MGVFDKVQISRAMLFANATALGAALFITALVLPAKTASAGLVGMNDISVIGPNSGDGFNLTLDDQTGLKWLDLTITRGMSRNGVLASSLITGGAYRYATDAEVNQLFGLNVGISFSGSGQFTPNFANFGIITAGRVLMNALGRTNTQVPVGSWGLVDSTTTLPGGYNTYSIRESTLPSTNLLRINRAPWEASSGAFGFGSFLVADTAVSPVPLPAAFPLYGTGLAIMGFIGWRRKRRKALAR